MTVAPQCHDGGENDKAEHSPESSGDEKPSGAPFESTSDAPCRMLLHASGNYPQANAQHQMMLQGLKDRNGAAVRHA
jgi:hypothetical protein